MLLIGNPSAALVNGISEIADVLEVAISSGSWATVSIPDNMYPKAVYITTRDGASFLLSHDAAGIRYATIPSGFGIDFVANPAQTIFYVQGTSSTTLEVILTC